MHLCLRCLRARAEAQSGAAAVATSTVFHGEGEGEGAGERLPALKIWTGQPYPLGATFDGLGTNFSLFSEVAERVELCLFDDARRRRRGSTCPRSTATAGTATSPASRPGQRYGYRVHGPWDPENGPAVQPGQAAARPVRQGHRGDVDWDRPSSPTTSHDPTRPNDDRQRAVRAALGRRQPLLRLGRRPPAAHAPCTRR